MIGELAHFISRKGAEQYGVTAFLLEAELDELYAEFFDAVDDRDDVLVEELAVAIYFCGLELDAVSAR